MIEIVNDAGYEVDEARLQEAATLVLARHEGDSDGDITIAITDDDSVADLNLQYRGVDAPTDVLSFPMDADMPTETKYLGDLVIAYAYTAAQAEREGHSLADTLTLLVVHGTLHLLGYDHDTSEHRADMWAAQEAALVALGVPLEIVPALEDGIHDEPQE